MTATGVPWARGVVAALLVLAGCGTGPGAVAPLTPDAPPPTLGDRARADYEAGWRVRADAATTERRWNDAAIAWELLATLRPDDPQVAERLADSRLRNRAALADLEARAGQAERRGDLDAAAQCWWAMLALDPSHAGAAAALRKLESDRVRKLYLGRHAGSAATRRAVARLAALPASAPPVASSRETASAR